MQRGSLWGIERWCWNWGFIPASDVGFKFLWSREGTGQPQVPPSCFRLVSNKVRCTMQESGEEGGRRQTSCLRVTGEPEGGKRNSCHSPSPVASGSDLKGPDISEDFWWKVGLQLNRDAIKVMSPGEPLDWAWDWRFQKQSFQVGFVSFVLGGTFLHLSSNLVTRQY